MGRPLKKFKKKDIHISLDYDIYHSLIDFLNSNKSIGKSELIGRLIEEFLKNNDLI